MKPPPPHLGRVKNFRKAFAGGRGRKFCFGGGGEGELYCWEGGERVILLRWWGEGVMYFTLEIFKKCIC